MEMDKLMLQEYRTRWQAVATAEKIEQQSASFAQRWRQLNSIIRMATALDLQINAKDDQIETVRQRWNKLKTAYLNACENRE